MKKYKKELIISNLYKVKAIGRLFCEKNNKVIGTVEENSYVIYLGLSDTQHYIKVLYGNVIGELHISCLIEIHFPS